jgi:hypothetical protein
VCWLRVQIVQSMPFLYFVKAHRGGTSGTSMQLDAKFREILNTGCT